MLLTVFCPVVRSQEHLAPIMSFHPSLFKMVGLHYMPSFKCWDCKDNTSCAAGLKICGFQFSRDELRLAAAFRQPSSRAVRIFSEYGVTEERVEARLRDASDGEDSTGLQPVHR